MAPKPSRSTTTTPPASSAASSATDATLGSASSAIPRGSSWLQQRISGPVPPSEALLVEITWSDAQLDPAEELQFPSTSPFGALYLRRDIGYLVSLTPEMTVCSLSVGPDVYMHSNTIPTAWIHEIQVLERTGECLKIPAARKKRRKKAPITGF